MPGISALMMMTPLRMGRLVHVLSKEFKGSLSAGGCSSGCPMKHLSTCTELGVSGDATCSNGANLNAGDDILVDANGAAQAVSFSDQDQVSLYISVLLDCIRMRDLARGRKVHSQIVKCGYGTNSHLGNTLVRMYAKCGRLQDARQVFDTLADRDGLTWSALISAYIKQRHSQDAGKLFEQMRRSDLSLTNRVALISVLKACGSLGDLKQGRLIHSQTVRLGLERDMFVSSSLITMYMHCRSVEDAMQVFEQLAERDVVSYNAMIAGYAQNGRGEEAIALFYCMLHDGFIPTPSSFVSVLKACASVEALEYGIHIHSKVVKSGFESDVVVGNVLVHFYLKSRNFEEARQVFDNLSSRDVVTWSAMIAGCAQHACGEEGVALFRQMQLEGIHPNIVTFVNIIKACTSLESLEQGKIIHNQIVESGCERDILVGTTLVDMYAKHGSMEAAYKVFRGLSRRDLVAWNAMITGCAQHGHGEEALMYFSQMSEECLEPNDVTFLSLLKACASLQSLEFGAVLHSELTRRGYAIEGVVGNALIDMYVNCSSLEEARQVFDRLSKRDIVSWNALIGGYAQHNCADEALTLFGLMQRDGVKADNVTFVCVLKACDSLGALEQGKVVHHHIVGEKIEGDVFLGSTIVQVYATCQSLVDAREVFEKMSHEDLVPWNVMIGGYCQQGITEEALTLFGEMQCAGVKPNAVTVLSILKACATVPSPAALEQGRRIHSYIAQNGLDSDDLVGNALVHMYASCGCLQDAEQVFHLLSRRDIVSWNTLIAGYAQHGSSEEAMTCFQRMHSEGMRPDSITFISILKACVGPEHLQQGRTIHAQVIEQGSELEIIIGNAIVDMYAKCGDLEGARDVFDNLPQRDIVSWNSIVAGYSQHGHVEEAFELFGFMQNEGTKPDNLTFATMLNGCANYVALQQGVLIHDAVIQRGFDTDVLVGNTLVDMYSKCGSLDDACKVFNKLPKQVVSTWNTMIAGYGRHGQGLKALQCFKKMQKADVMPNSLTYLCLLSACSHAGLVEEAYHLFRSMSSDYGIQPSMEHYCSLVDVLGRAGRLDEAEDVVDKMPMEPDAAVWTSLLGACKSHLNIEIGRRAAAQVLNLDPNNTAAYLLLMDILAAANVWDEVASIKTIMREFGMKKLVPGLCWIEADSMVHSFVAGERSHPESKEIYAELRKLTGPLEGVGYVPILHWKRSRERILNAKASANCVT